MKPAIVGIAGKTLTDAERALFAAQHPAGVILFARNIEDAAQLRALTDDLRSVLPADAVLMVDQEGGRVARLRPPHWHAHPSAAAIGALYAQDEAAGLRAAFLTGALIGADCRAAGFDVACAPVLDLAIAGAHSVIGDRAYAEDPYAVARIARALADGLMAAGVQPVGKHVPGHGRALADSHLELPTVQDNDIGRDLTPFRICADLPWAMTAHILYPHWDPLLPASLSTRIIEDVIRGQIGFTGMLVSDDLTMKALSGDAATLARQALTAGCDAVLHCNGVFAETEALLRDCPPMGEEAAKRFRHARAMAEARLVDFNPDLLAAERNALLALS